MIKPTLLLTSCLLLIGQISHGQIVTNSGDDPKYGGSQSGNSPQGGNSIFNTDFYSGTTGINIPIFDYKINELDFGVALTYNTAGVKVDQIASSAGMGWNINAASSIERVPNGLEDEVLADSSGHYTVRGAWNAGIGAASNTTTSDNDLFIANLAGRQIKFAIDLHGTTSYGANHLRYATIPTSGIKIELFRNDTLIYSPINYATSPEQYVKYNFRITDEKGTVFNFDKVDDQYKSIDLPRTTEGPTTAPPIKYYYTIATKWWASSVVANTGATVVYTYNAINAAYPIYRSEKIIEQQPSFMSDGHGNSFTSVGMPPAISTEKVMYTGNTQNISQIKYPNGTIVDFVYRSDFRKDLPGMKILDHVDISAGYTNNKNKISYQMYQTYMHYGNSGLIGLTYNANDTDRLNYRLFLNYIERTVNSQSPERYYTFTYDETPLPPRLSPLQDYYGYYNYNGASPTAPSAYSNSTPSETPAWAVPLHWFHCLNGNNYKYGAVKTPYLDAMDNGVLKKVKNSLAGEFEIYYDAHVLSNPPNSLSTFPQGDTISENSYDGLRTQKIVYRDGATSDNDYTIAYTYNNGYRFYTKLYFWYPHLFVSPINAQVYWLNSTVHSTNYYNGFNHGYSDVTETQTGYAGAVLGKTDYHYTNILYSDDDPLKGIGEYDLGHPKLYHYATSDKTLTNPSRMNASDMGLLLYTRHYIGNNSTPNSIDSNQYELTTIYNAYTFPTLYPEQVAGFTYFTPVMGAGLEYGSLYQGGVDAYLFYTNTFRIKKTVTVNYSGTSQQMTTNQYEYDRFDNTLKIKWVDSKGAQFYKFFSYDTTHTFQYPTSNGLAKVVGGSNVVFSYNTTDAISSLPILHNKFYSLKTVDGVLDNAITYTIDKEYTVRDLKKNALEVSYENGLRYKSQLWDTRIDQKIAEVDNARLADIAYTSFEGLNYNANNDKGGWTFDTSYVGKFDPATNYVLEAITGKYLYKLNTSTSNKISIAINSAQNYVLSFWADLPPVVKCGGTTLTMTVSKTARNNFRLYSTIISNPFVSPPVSMILTIEGTTTVSTAGFIDELRLYPQGASMTTTAYDPLIGIITSCDARNNIIYTDYDAQGRPTRTRDVYGNIITQTITSIQAPNN
jgi:hypothetical protein